MMPVNVCSECGESSMFWESPIHHIGGCRLGSSTTNTNKPVIMNKETDLVHKEFHNAMLAVRDGQIATLKKENVKANDLLVDAFQYLTPFTKIYEEIEDFLAEQGGEG